MNKYSILKNHLREIYFDEPLSAEEEAEVEKSINKKLEHLNYLKEEEITEEEFNNQNESLFDSQVSELSYLANNFIDSYNYCIKSLSLHFGYLITSVRIIDNDVNIKILESKIDELLELSYFPFLDQINFLKEDHLQKIENIIKLIESNIEIIKNIPDNVKIKKKPNNNTPLNDADEFEDFLKYIEHKLVEFKSIKNIFDFLHSNTKFIEVSVNFNLHVFRDEKAFRLFKFFETNYFKPPTSKNLIKVRTGQVFTYLSDTDKHEKHIICNQSEYVDYIKSEYKEHTYSFDKNSGKSNKDLFYNDLDKIKADFYSKTVKKETS